VHRRGAEDNKKKNGKRVDLTVKFASKCPKGKKEKLSRVLSDRAGDNRLKAWQKEESIGTRGVELVKKGACERMGKDEGAKKRHKA